MRIKLQDVMAGVCIVFGVTPEELRDEKRIEPISIYRAITYYLARSMTNASYPAIGEYFNRHHTTILLARDKIGQGSGLCPVRDRLTDKCRTTIRKIAIERTLRDRGLSDFTQQDAA